MIKLFSKSLIMMLLVTISTSVMTQAEQTEETFTPQQIASEQLKETIAVWAGAWQSQLPDLYIAHYMPEYFASDFSNRTAWLEDRRERLMEPDYIRIRLIDFELSLLVGELAVVRFKLVYERPGYADETYKELTLNKSNGIWLIESEQNLEVKVL